MSSYPVLKNRPIDQWKVTELKDELRKRRLPVKGLKEELVRRLFDSIRSEAEDEAATDVEVNTQVNPAPGEQTASEKTTVSVTEVIQGAVVNVTQESTVPLTEVTREFMVSAVDEHPKDNAVVTYESPASVAPKSKGYETESVTGENSTVHPDINSEPIIEKTPEIDTNETAFVDGATNADLRSDITSSEVKSVAMEGGKTEKQDTVPTPVGTLASDADPMDTDVAAAAGSVTNSAERLVHMSDLGKNVSTYDDECKNSAITEDSKPIVSKPNNQVPEVSPDLGSHYKSESISTDDISNNKINSIKDNLNANNFDLELEVKPGMVKPSSGTTLGGDDLQPMDDDKELVKNQLCLEDIDSTTNVEEVGSPEKLNLDRSSGDESMEEDVMEIKQVESDAKSDDIRGKAEVNSEHVKEVNLLDSVVDSSSVGTKDVVADEKSAASAEKRKHEAEATAANTEPIKRQRRWIADSGKVPDRQPLSQSGSDAPKDIFKPALRRSFGRSDSTASGDSPKERVVPPPQKPATTSLKIDRFVRPFTLRAVQELLGKTGSVCSFWMDHIKTHCYVTFSSVEEAVATRGAVYNLQWPPNNGNHLVAEFVDPQEVKLKLEPPPPPLAAATSAALISPVTAPRDIPFQQAQANQNVSRQATTPREQLPPPPLVKPPTTDQGSARDKLPPTPKKPEPPVVTLDDLFRKTQSSPRIYYLPLSEEDVAAKLAAQGKGKRE